MYTISVSCYNDAVERILQEARSNTPEDLQRNYRHTDDVICWTYIDHPDLRWISAVQYDMDWGWDVAGILRRVYSSGTLENDFMEEIIATQAEIAKDHGFLRLFVGTHKDIPRYFKGQMDRWSRLTGDKWQCDGRRYWVRNTPQLVAWTGECPHEPVLD